MVVDVDVDLDLDLDLDLDQDQVEDQDQDHVHVHVQDQDVPTAIRAQRSSAHRPVPGSVTCTGMPARSFPSRFLTVTSTG